MNEFTKDELIDLNIIVSCWYAKHIDDQCTGKLAEKIQSMIDNYCEHHDTTGCLDCNSTICEKCNFRWEDDNQ